MDLFSFISTLFAFAVIIPTCLISISLIATVFWIAMLIRITQNERGEDKTTWVLIVLFLHGIGALIYWFVRGRYHPRSRNDLLNIVGYSTLALMSLCVISFLPIFPSRPTPYYAFPTYNSNGVYQTLTALPEIEKQTRDSFVAGRTQTRAAQIATDNQAATLSAFDSTQTSINKTAAALAVAATQTQLADSATQTATLFTPTPTVPSRTPTRLLTVTRTHTATRKP